MMNNKSISSGQALFFAPLSYRNKGDAEMRFLFSSPEMPVPRIGRLNIDYLVRRGGAPGKVLQSVFGFWEPPCTATQGKEGDGLGNFGTGKFQLEQGLSSRNGG